MQTLAIEIFTFLTYNTESTFINRRFFILNLNLTFHQLLCCIVTLCDMYFLKMTKCYQRNM